jgi:hypothetical protein
MIVSSADTRPAFNSGFDTVNLHRPTLTIAAFIASIRLSLGFLPPLGSLEKDQIAGAYTRPFFSST